MVGHTEELTAQRARLTRTIFTAVALGSTSLYAAFTASVLVATELGTSRAWAGVPGAAGILGTAAGAASIARIMARRGRRVGLRFGWLVGMGGALLAALAVVLSSFVGLVACMVLLGVGHASNQLARFAAADMHAESRRPTVLGWVVWAGSIGAVLGPSLLGPVEVVARMIGVTVLTSGFLVAIAFYGAAILWSASLRPDPSMVAEEDTTTIAAKVSLRDQWRLPHVQIAVVILVTAQLAMTAIMTMTPLHIREHGHAVGLIGVVMSAHFVGMFALAPVIGSVVARIGSIKVASAGLSVVIIAAIGAATVPGRSPLGIAGFLFVLGLGWCMGFVSGSSLLTRELPYVERVRLQGAIDAIVWTASALASLASGILLAAFGYTTLALVGAVAVVGPLVVVGSGRRRLDPAPAEA